MIWSRGEHISPWYRSDCQSTLVWSGYDIKTALLGKWVTARCSATCSSPSWLLTPKGMQHACLLLEHIGGSSGGELLSGQERAGREGSSSRSFRARRSIVWLRYRYCRYIYPPILSINKDTCEGSLLCWVSLGRGITGRSRYYTSR